MIVVKDPSAIFGGAKKTAIFKIAKDQVRAKSSLWRPSLLF